MVKKIVDIKHPALSQKSKPVVKFDKKTKQLIKDLWDTLEAQKDPEGIGLAAPQIGKNLQVFIVNYGRIKQVFINPKVISKPAHLNKTPRGKEILEGCLSLPHYYSPIIRANKIKIEYLTEKGQKEKKEFKGFIAQIIQHEIDHLKGKIFIDETLKQKLPLYKFDGNNWEEVDFT